MPTKKQPIVSTVTGRYLEVVIEDNYAGDRIFTMVARLDLVNNRITISKPYNMGGSDKSYVFVNSDPAVVLSFARCATKALEILNKEISK